MANKKYTANQDIRDYMEDHSITQKILANQMGVDVMKVNRLLKVELSQQEKENFLRHIDAIIEDRKTEAFEEDSCEESAETESDEEPIEEPAEEPTTSQDVSCTTKFQIGDRVKVPSKTNRIGTVIDIWSSLAKSVFMYAVKTDDDGHCGMYAEDQLEIAPLPIEYTFTTTIEDNVAVVCMIAHQGDKTWVYARGHAHILHDGAVGMAQAVSYASKRMFESLDTAQDKQIYFKTRK